VIGLVIGGIIGAVLMLYAADRVLAARAQVRRLRMMSGRLAAAAARAEKQHEQRQAAVRTSAELTSVLPAIKRPLTQAGQPPHGDHPSERASETGDRACR
jgi:type II secretory pathway pseudopilin PulG